MDKEDSRVVVKRIVIKIGEKEVSLSVDEARELKNILGEMFGGKVTEYVPYSVPVYPWYPRPYVSPYWYVSTGDADNGTVVYCTSKTGGE